MANQPSGQGANTGSVVGSYGPPVGFFGRLTPPNLPRRGGQRRRRDNHSRAIHTLTPYFDGRLWRKYGQKKIKDAQYPRLYFRCSYREDRHCMASKLVQQVNNDDPPLYEVTYMHDHTCKAEHIPPPDIDVMDAAGPPDASDGFVLNFGSSSGGRGGHRDALMIPEVRQPVPPSPFTTTCFGSSSSSDSQIMHENLDSFQINDDALWSPAELWPSTSSDGGDLFSAWDSFSGFGFDNHAPYPESTFSWEANMGIHQSLGQLSMYGN